MEEFKRVLKHWLVLALSSSGYEVGPATIANIEQACDALFADIEGKIKTAIDDCCCVWENQG